MLLTAVIIILREVLEIALLTSILLTVGKQMNLSTQWFFYSIFAGLAGAFIYALNTSSISEWLDYTGQEVVNGSSQILIFIFITLLVFISRYQSASIKKIVPILMALSMALLISREGSEIYIYISAFSSQSEHLPAVLAGSVIGAAIGLSIGALFYYTLSYREDKVRNSLSMVFLAIIASGILSQAIPMFMQADLIEPQSPMWDSSFLLSEKSLAGQLVYAVAGYEASPTPLQFSSNLVGLVTILLLAFMPNSNTDKGMYHV